MQEWPYAKEPFDFKLFVLLFLRKIWIVLCGILLGTVVIGGIYYMRKVVFGGPTEYEITSTYYVEYNRYDEETGELGSYINEATWGSWVVTDWFVDRAWEHSLELGMVPENYGVEKNDLKDYFFATLATDLHIPSSTVTTPYQELTTFLNEALQLTFEDFANDQQEIDEIRVIDETLPEVSDKDVRTLRACILGAVVGLLVAGFGIAFVLIWDDSIRVPEQFTYRYGLLMVGFVSQESAVLEDAATANIKYLFREKEKCMILTLGENIKTEQLFSVLPANCFQEAVACKDLNEVNYEKLRQAEGILLAIEAGSCKGKEIEHILHELQLQNCQVLGALLCNADCMLIKTYRYGKIRG